MTEDMGKIIKIIYLRVGYYGHIEEDDYNCLVRVKGSPDVIDYLRTSLPSDYMSKSKYAQLVIYVPLHDVPLLSVNPTHLNKL